MSRIKNYSKKNKSSSTVEKNCIPIANDEQTINRYIQNYEFEIQPQQWLIHQQIDMHGVCTIYQLEGLCSMDITQQQLKQLIEKQLKLCALLDPIMQALQQRYQQLRITKMKKTCKEMSLPMQSFLKIIRSISNYQSANIIPDKIDLKILLKVLQKQQFLRFLTKNCRYRMLINNRSTQLNTKTIIVGIILYKLKKLKYKQISEGVLLFNLQQSYTENAPYGVFAHYKEVFELLIKLNRSFIAEKVLDFLQRTKQICNPQKPKKAYLSIDKFLCLLALTNENNNTDSIFEYKKVNGKIIFKKNLFHKGKFNDLFHKETDTKPQETNQQFLIEGIPFFTPNVQKYKNNQQVYKNIKRCLSLKHRPKTSLLEFQIQKVKSISRKNKAYSQCDMISSTRLKQIQNNIEIEQSKKLQKNSKNMPKRFHSSQNSPKYFQPWLSCTSKLKIQSILKTTFQMKRSKKVRKIYREELKKYGEKQRVY